MARSTLRTALTLAVVLLLSACGSELDKARDQFIDSCADTGADEPRCECAFDHLKAHYGEKGIVAMQSGESPPPDFASQLVKAAQQCSTR